LFLASSARFHPPIRSDEIEVTLQSSTAAKISAALPKLISPNKPLAVQPLPDEGPKSQPDVKASPRSSVSITIPAEAIPGWHAFPKLPATETAPAKPVRLTISIAEDGTVEDADILESCGASDLDELAAIWVKEHWRYRPATQDGIAIAVTTTAALVFIST